MPQYYWKGTTRSGEKKSGIIEANSSAFAKNELYKQGLVSKQLRRKYSFFTKSNITPTQIFNFYRQLAVLLKAGIPLIQSFAIVIQSQNHFAFQQVLASVKKTIENGFPFATAMRVYPAFFNELECRLISVGETTGKLDTILEIVASHKEKMITIKRKIKKTLTYPTIVLFIAGLVMFFLITFVIPQFELLYNSFGASLPIFTQIVIQLCSFLRNDGLLFSFMVFCVSFSVIRCRNHSSKLSEWLDNLLINLPIIGPFIIQTIIARFLRTLAITFAAGFPITYALQAASEVTTNSIYAKALVKIGENINAGQPIHLAIKDTSLFPNLVIQLITIGEESGNLESMLYKLADSYEIELNQAIDRLTILLEPIIMTLLGFIVGGLVIAMYLPIFRLSSVV